MGHQNNNNNNNQQQKRENKYNKKFLDAKLIFLIKINCSETTNTESQN